MYFPSHFCVFLWLLYVIAEDFALGMLGVGLGYFCMASKLEETASLILATLRTSAICHLPRLVARQASHRCPTQPPKKPAVRLRSSFLPAWAWLSPQALDWAHLPALRPFLLPFSPTNCPRTTPLPELSPEHDQDFLFFCLHTKFNKGDPPHPTP